MTRFLPPLALILGLGGCLFPSMVRSNEPPAVSRPSYPPPLFRDYLAVLQAKERLDSTIPTSLSLPHEIPLEGTNFFLLYLASIDANQICLAADKRGKPRSVMEDAVEEYDTDFGTIERQRVVKIRACGPRPAITPETRFLAISIHDTKPRPKTYEPYERGRSDNARIEEENQRVRRLGDDLIVVPITDGSADLTP